MDSKKIVIWVIVAIVLVGGAFLLFRPTSSGGVTDVNAQEMQELADQGVRIVDVRTPGEYEAGHIPGAELVPVNVIQAESQNWDKTEPLAIYCATGSRSIEVVNYLADQGFEEIYHYASGIVTWEGEVERGDAALAAEAAPAPETETSGLPVMYEFYTDS
jgi:rhodanese-related sulfurtransferase